MNAQDLKNSILQLAVQGKLVEQRVEEGTAKELLAQIKAEKEQLIKDKKIKKEKALPEITDEEIPFEIPESWEWVRVGNIGSWSSGATPSRHNLDYYNGNIPWLKTGDLNDGYISEIPEHVGELALEKTSLRVNPVGSVLMAMYGATIGKLGILEIEATTNQACCACIPYSCIINKYLFYYLMSQRKVYISMGAGGAQPNISKEKIVMSLIALPPLVEQKRIVAKIEEILPYIEQYDKAYTKLEAFNKKFPEDMKKSILQMAMQGKLVEQRPEEGTADELYEQIVAEKARLIKEGKIKKEKPLSEITEDEIPFDIPESWKWVRLNSIVYNSGQCKPKDRFCYIDIGSIDNKNQKLSKEDSVIEAKDAPSRARKIVKFGDIIYSTVRPYLHNMCIIDREFPYMPIASTGFAVLSCVEGIYNKFLFYYLLSPEFDRYANSTENSKGVAYPAINDDRLYRALIPLPPLAEQKRIVAKLEQMLPYCDQLIK